ncbi:hypothetical protein V6N13_105908 [Hibiscus sabdariffa]|uniref:Plant heme peroxidase family profile domain-containing protein n=1 Tax=Hibiscus sabdariffa TaxID=183260 RepID=A0ABR2EZ43_9ROSI
MAMAFPVAVVDTKYLEEIEKACRYLPPLIAFKNCAPITLRLAWHDAGTYGVNTKTSGARNTSNIAMASGSVMLIEGFQDLEWWN